MKKMVFVVLMAAVSCVLSAQSRNLSYEKGYKANVELGAKIYQHGRGSAWMATTSHGHSFGNGLYVGGGSGLCIETHGMLADVSARVCIPIFADLKYSFLNRIASPFVSLKAGGYYDYTQCGVGYFVRPAVGIDIWRFSLNAGIDYMKCGYASESAHKGGMYQTVTMGDTGVYVGLSFKF